MEEEDIEDERGKDGIDYRAEVLRDKEDKEEGEWRNDDENGIIRIRRRRRKRKRSTGFYTFAMETILH